MDNLCRNCLVNTKTFRTIQKLSGQCRNCLDNPKNVRTIQKLSGQSSNSPDNPETFQTIQKLSEQSKKPSRQSSIQVYKIERLMREQKKTKHEKGFIDDTNIEENLLPIQGSKGIAGLCNKA